MGDLGGKGFFGFGGVVVGGLWPHKGTINFRSVRQADGLRSRWFLPILSPKGQSSRSWALSLLLHPQPDS